jgi:enoyl-[acyl-carrier protein] reductase III
MNIDFTNRVAFITGSSRGIGKATALKFAANGADVVLNYSTQRKAAVAVAEEIEKLGRRCWILKGDVSEQYDVNEMIAFIKSEIGRLDFLVSNAATGGFRQLLDADTGNFDGAFHTNVLALLYLVQAAMPLLERQGTAQVARSKIVTVSSHGSYRAIPYYGLIGASKAALEALVRHLTLEIGDRGVNINVVRAGLVETDSTKRLPNSDVMFREQINYTQVGERTLKDSDVADAIMFLCSPFSDMIQGEVITVDGGSGYRAG